MSKLTEVELLADLEKINDQDRYHCKTTYDIFCHAADEYAADIAIVEHLTADRDEVANTLTFATLAKKLNQTAKLYQAFGVERTDVISILLPNLAETHLSMWAAQAVGIANPINYLLQVDHIVEILNEVKSKVLVTVSLDQSTELGKKVHEIIARVPSLEHILVLDNRYGPSNNNRITITDFNQAISTQSSERLTKTSQPKADDIAMYFHTGGTTGRPKVAKLSHYNISFVVQVYAGFNAFQGKSAVLNALPLFHVFGVIAASLSMFFVGRQVVIMTPEGFRNPNTVKNWWFFVNKYQVCWFPTVPTIISVLLQQPDEDIDLSCFEHAACGSAPLPIELKLSFQRRFNCNVTNGYGMTESSCVVARVLPGYDVEGVSVGNGIPYSRVIAAHVIDNKISRVCSANEPGIILVKGPNIFQGYLNESDNEGAWVDGEWFNTGDLGLINDLGHIQLTGRAKDLIIRGGHNIDPQIIEDALMTHAGVLQAVAIGQPDAHAGEIPVAYVVVKDPQQTTAAELLLHCQTHINERAAIPKRIEILDSFPLTAVGKVFKPILRNKATEFSVNALFKANNITAQVSAAFDPEKGQVVHIQLSNTQDKDKVAALLIAVPVLVDYQTTL
ncbi:acyl-CoA synthetase [Colwellia sp. MB02u-18]|uniref:acyl-CoA synthetase n=1 Tax=unclassified Colwellia TaxID=196834 RepID=UPI0015F50A2D|nr:MULTISPECIES: acyl-CoA synthetase [unclassified Colwellia]MBA6222783.1 acyl-CoA synthetase [Colwellia sp. MB3u-45]MBA6266010.1 acyl-CoA synthetase [Colwellia sp. MB3u-43]MBA6320450.1 acyl-CoA synthetase [Colwellia sp. MB02u-19]MBA6323337.1 acyl-CoA synthetase [Colwellia sp. MB02u-18]MBA6329835.1 acyl-CoA synthetase [Colwellia sp. MB02u-12]